MSALTFAGPPPGLEPLVDFTLADVDGAPGLHTMQSSQNPGIRLFVIDAPVYLPWYEPTFDSENYDLIGAGSSDDADVLVVATIADGAPIVNLMAPILVNRSTGAASQVILGDEWPLRASLAEPGAA